jgi:UPF0176 protein
MEKIILFYKFTPLKDPQTVMLWQRALAEANGLKGRVIISRHGINATLGGRIEGLKRYVKETKLHLSLNGTQFKWSDGSADDFPRLSVKVRAELVSFGASREVKVNKKGVVGGGRRLKPKQLHRLVMTRSDVVLFDGRNAFEAAIGRFKDAVVPNTATSRDFLAELSNDKYDNIKEKAVVTYCTGGIRCEVLSLLMKNRGFKEVYQLDGGIVRYGEEFGDNGLWQGKLHVFDRRMATSFSDESADIGHCSVCNGQTSRYINCMDATCNRLVLVCTDCRDVAYCSRNCRSNSVKPLTNNKSVVN